MTKVNYSKSELVDAFSHCVRSSLIVCRYSTLWICPYRNNYGTLVYCVIRLDAGASLSKLPYKTLRVMANLLDGMVTGLIHILFNVVRGRRL